jgi:hypothetical protein
VRLNRRAVVPAPFGIPIRRVGFTAPYDINRNQLVKLRQEGLTVPQIAERFGCSHTTVERAGSPTRSSVEQATCWRPLPS